MNLAAVECRLDRVGMAHAFGPVALRPVGLPLESARRHRALGCGAGSSAAWRTAFALRGWDSAGANRRLRTGLHGRRARLVRSTRSGLAWLRPATAVRRAKAVEIVRIFPLSGVMTILLSRSRAEQVAWSA